MANLIQHPSKLNFERWRVWDKTLKIQKYFKKNDYESAHEYFEKINKKRWVQDKLNELYMNKLFIEHEDGSFSVRNLKRVYYVRKDGRSPELLLQVQITVSPKKYVTRRISLRNRSFEQAYRLIQLKILEAHGATETPEITERFLSAKSRYW